MGRDRAGARPDRTTPLPPRTRADRIRPEAVRRNWRGVACGVPVGLWAAADATRTRGGMRRKGQPATPGRLRSARVSRRLRACQVGGAKRGSDESARTGASPSPPRRPARVRGAVVRCERRYPSCGLRYPGLAPFGPPANGRPPRRFTTRSSNARRTSRCAPPRDRPAAAAPQDRARTHWGRARENGRRCTAPRHTGARRPAPHATRTH